MYKKKYRKCIEKKNELKTNDGNIEKKEKNKK